MAVKGFLTALYLMWSVLGAVTNGQFFPNIQPNSFLPQSQPSGSSAFQPNGRQNAFTPGAQSTGFGTSPHGINPDTSSVHPGNLNIPQLVSSLLSPGSGFIPLHLNGPTNPASQNRPDSNVFHPQQTRPFGINNQNPGSIVNNPQPKPFNQPQFNSPFNPHQSNPFNSQQSPPFNHQQSNPFNSQQSHPFSQQSTPFNQQSTPLNQQSTPFNQQSTHFNQHIAPFNHQQTNPFSHQISPFNAQQTNPFNPHQTSPFTLQQNRPFIPPQTNPFNLNQNRPFTSPQTYPFNHNQNRPFISPQTSPFNLNQNRPFISPQTNPFNSNQNRPPFLPQIHSFNPQPVSSFSNPQETNPLHSISNLKNPARDPNFTGLLTNSPNNTKSQDTIPTATDFQPNSPSSSILKQTNPDSISPQQTGLDSNSPKIIKTESASPQQVKPDSINPQQLNPDSTNPLKINPDSTSSEQTDSDLITPKQTDSDLITPKKTDSDSITLKQTDSDSKIPPKTDSDSASLPQTDPNSTESPQTDSDSTETPQTDSDLANTQQTSLDSTNSQQSDSSNPKFDLLRDLQKIFLLPDNTEPISSASDTSVSNVSQDTSSLTTPPQQTTDIPYSDNSNPKHGKQPPSEPADDPLKGRRIVCLFNNKHFYKKGFSPAKLEPHLCTHVNYEFAILDPKTYEMIVGEPDLDINFYQEICDLKKFNPKLKIIISLGGWTDSTKKYSELAEDPEKRANFITKAVEFIQKHGFDGIDVAWEYPNCWQGAIGVSPKDKGNFVILLKELNVELKKYNFILSVSVGAIKREVEAAYDVPEISKTVDYINVMTYDMHGPWESKTSHHVQFEVMPGDTDPYCNVKGGMQVWIEKGASKRKLNMGFASYGRTFQLTNPNQCGMGVPARGPGKAFPPDNEGGRLSYNGMCQLLNSGDWIEKEDKHAGFYACSGDQWAAYDPPMMIVKKSKYVIDSGLYGILFKDLSGDDFEGKCSGMSFPLLKMARLEMEHRLKMHTHPRKHI